MLMRNVGLGIVLFLGHRGRIRIIARRVNFGKAPRTKGILARCFFSQCVSIMVMAVAKTKKEAMRLYLASAERGHATAQYNMGFSNLNGISIPKNEKKAVAWYKKAALQKDTDALRDLGFCYFYGKGIRRDQKHATELYRKAALLGDAKAAFNLGLCYGEGTGVKKSKRNMRFWMRRAAAVGHEKAKEILKRQKTL